MRARISDGINSYAVTTCAPRSSRATRGVLRLAGAIVAGLSDSCVSLRVRPTAVKCLGCLGCLGCLTEVGFSQGRTSEAGAGNACEREEETGGRAAKDLLSLDPRGPQPNSEVDTGIRWHALPRVAEPEKQPRGSGCADLRRTGGLQRRCGNRRRGTNRRRGACLGAGRASQDSLVKPGEFEASFRKRNSHCTTTSFWFGRESF